METLIINDQEKISISEELEHLLHEIATKAAEKFNLADEYELSVVLVDDEMIQDLNFTYRQIDEPTDVLSFAFNDNEEEESEFFSSGTEYMLGDIVISIERALAQSDDYGHSLEREIGFLFCHGLLHLLGYDHADAEEERIMFAYQEEILESVGLGR